MSLNRYDILENVVLIMFTQRVGCSYQGSYRTKV